MKRLFPSAVVLATSIGVWSCGGDPTGDLRDAPTRIVASPSTLFLNVGETKTVVVEVVDEAGDPFSVEDLSVSATGPGITVEKDPNFLGTTTGSPLQTRAQFIVTGTSAAGSSFTLSHGGLSEDVPVSVTPTNVEATISNAAPAQNEPVTISAEGLVFLPEATITIGGNEAIITGRADDGSSVTFVPIPGSTGPATLAGMEISFLPGTPITVETNQEFAVAPFAPLGTEDPSTAPTVGTPGEGETVVFFDKPAFATTPDHFYRLVIPADATYNISMDWDIGGDIDMFLCPDPGAITASCDFTAATGDHPEVADYALTAGTWYIVADDFGGDANGTTLELVITPAAPSTGE